MAPKHDERPSVPAGYKVPDVWTHPEGMGGKFGGMNRPTAGARFDKPLPVGDHKLQLYSLGTPNGQKVTILLEEMGVEYDGWMVNIMGDEPAQFGSGFTEANPNSKIPALMDHSEAGMSSEPIRVFESAHILLYLAEKHGGKFMPPSSDIRARVECMNWLFWQAGSAPYIGGGFGHFYSYAPTNFEYAIDRFAMETKRQLDVLDKQLAGKSFVCGGDEPTIADFAIFPWVRCCDVFYSAKEFLQMDSYTNVSAWCARLEARPAVQRGLRVNGFGADAVKERHSPEDFK